LRQLCRQATRRGIRLDFEHSPREAVDDCRITARGYRDQRHALGGKEILSLARRHLVANERFDLVALELLDAKVRRDPFREALQLRVLEAREERRMGQQDACVERVMLRWRGLRCLDEILDLIIGESIRIGKDRNRRGEYRGAGRLRPRAARCRRARTRRTLAG